MSENRFFAVNLDVKKYLSPTWLCQKSYFQAFLVVKCLFYFRHFLSACEISTQTDKRAKNESKNKIATQKSLLIDNFPL